MTTARYSPAALEPRWQTRARLRRVALPVGLDDWLLNSGSLTRRLRRACADGFEVRVLDQDWGRPLPSEARLLRLAGGQRAWIREVQLRCAGEPWVYARTVIPAATLQGRGQRLQRLGARPLGEVLFTEPGVRRGVVEIARIAPGQWLHRRIFGVAAPAVWGRRSLFYFGRRPLLVNEIFLPALPLPGSIHNHNKHRST